MNFKIPAVFSAVMIVLILLINMIIGNPLSTIFFRVLLSGILIYLIVFAVIFVFVTLLKVEFANTKKRISAEDDHEEGMPGENVDYTVGDEDYHESDDDRENIDMNSDVFNEDDHHDVDMPPNSSDEDFEDLEEVEYEDYQANESDANEHFNDFSSSTVKSSGNAIKDKLGMDATAEDLAKAIRTKLKKDE